MGYHWNVNLEIECGSAEEAERLHSYLEQHNLEDDCVTFETNGFFIAGNNFYFDANENSVYIGDETHSNDIDRCNFYDFIAEIEEIGKKVNATIKNIKLDFLSQECDGFYTYIKTLPQKAFDKFVSNMLKDETEYGEYTDEEVKTREEEIRNEYKGSAWMIWCEPEGVDELAKNDPDGRESLWEFEEELNVWTRRIISEWKFPWNEGCHSLWAGAIDKDGEFLWENS